MCTVTLEYNKNDVTARQQLTTLLSTGLFFLVEDKERTPSKPHITLADLEITPHVAELGNSLRPLPSDFDYYKAKEEHLIEKYG